MPLLLGVVVLILGLWAVNAFSKADPKQVARLLRSMGGGGALLFALFLLLRGEIGPAVTIGAVGLGLLGGASRWPTIPRRRQKQAGQASRIRTSALEMELDHDTGVMRGRVLSGPHQGATLDQLDVASLIVLLSQVDRDSRDLLATYLDRREPGWREHAQGNAAAGGSSGASRGSKMTEQEAYQILDIQPGSSLQEISRAHRSLMKKMHPDQGGSTYLAARINEAKDVLFRCHR